MPHSSATPSPQRRAAGWLLGTFFALSVAAATPALAQAPGSDAREKAKQEGFQPVAGAPDTEKIDASRLVIGAYAAVFFGMFGYIVYVARRQSEMAKEMTALAELIQKSASRD